MMPTVHFLKAPPEGGAGIYTPGSDGHGPGLGGVRGCGFEEREGAHARTKGGRLL